MNRRSLLKWVSRMLGFTCMLLVAIPGVGYVFAPFFCRRPTEAILRRVAKLNDLPVRKPRRFAVNGRRQDAWTHYPEQTVGRVWLIRRSDETVGPSESKVDAFTTVCPHLACETQWDAGEGRFGCPCHKAAWNTSGDRLSDQELGHRNPSPRGLDSLTCRLVQDESHVWWVEVEYERFIYGLADKTVRS